MQLLNEKLFQSLNRSKFNIYGSRRGETRSVASSLMLKEAQRLTQQGKYVLYFSMEETALETINNMENEINMSYFQIVDAYRLTPVEIELEMLRFYKKHKEEPDYVMVESLDLLYSSSDEKRPWQEEKELRDITLQLEKIMSQHEARYLFGTIFTRNVERPIQNNTPSERALAEKYYWGALENEIKRYGKLVEKAETFVAIKGKYYKKLK